MSREQTQRDRVVLGDNCVSSLRSRIFPLGDAEGSHGVQLFRLEPCSVEKCSQERAQHQGSWLPCTQLGWSLHLVLCRGSERTEPSPRLQAVGQAMGQGLVL